MHAWKWHGNLDHVYVDGAWNVDAVFGCGREWYMFLFVVDVLELEYELQIANA